MRIAVIAAAGRTGSRLVAELLGRGHDVSALVRHPEKLGPVADQVQVVVGDSTDPAALDQLLAGVDVVVISWMVRSVGGAMERIPHHPGPRSASARAGCRAERETAAGRRDQALLHTCVRCQRT